MQKLTQNKPLLSHFDFDRIIPLSKNQFQLTKQKSNKQKLIAIEEAYYFNLHDESSNEESLELTFSSISDVTMKCLEFYDEDSAQSVKALLLSVVDSEGEKKYYLLKMAGATTNLTKLEDADDNLLSSAVCENNFHNLSSREQDVIKKVAKGYTSDQIAELLFISPNTVKNHRKSIKKKLGFSCKQNYSKFLRWTLEYCNEQN